jgi:hypothetical protein
MFLFLPTFCWYVKREAEMKSKIILGCILACLILSMAVCVKTATAQGHSPSSPAPLGMPVVTMIECGEGYTSHELFDMKITLLEIVRGGKAWDLIKQASVSNKPPKIGFEYVLARIRFEFASRGSPRGCNHDLRREQLTALSADGKEYETPPVVPPKPELIGSLHSGKSLEGWAAFLVLQGDSKALMAFDPSSGGGMSRGRVVWFQLY